MYDKEAFLKQLKDMFGNLQIQSEHPFFVLIYTPTDMLRQSLGDDIDLQKTTIGLSVDMDQAEMDKIAANYLVVRGKGQKAVGRVTLAMSKPVSFRPSDLKAYATNGQIFSFTRTALVSESEFKHGSGYYYIDLDVIADTVGAAGNVAARSVTQVVNFAYPYLYVTNYNQMVNGADAQTNTEMLAAIKNSVTDYSLTRKPGLARSLMQATTDVQNGAVFEWFKIVGSGDSLMKRDVAEINGSMQHVFIMSDVWAYPTNGYLQESIDIEFPGVMSKLTAKPAIGPFVLTDSVGEIPKIYWKIMIENPAVDNSLQENKRIAYLNPNNRFTTKTPSSSLFKTYGVLRGHRFYSDKREVGIVNVGSGETDIFVDEEYPVASSASARTYETLYSGGSPYLTRNETTQKVTLYDTGNVNFNTIIDPDLYPSPYTDLYQVILVDSNGEHHFYDIELVAPGGTYIQFDGLIPAATSSYKIVKSNRMYRSATIAVTKFINPSGGAVISYDYFEAEFVSPEGGAIRLTEDIVMPIVSKINSEGLYMEYDGKYYRVKAIELAGKTLYVQLKYALPASPIPPDPGAMTSQQLFGLTSDGRFDTRSSISEIVSGSVSLSFNTYNIESLQAILNGDDERIIGADYLARLPYSVAVSVNVRYKGSAEPSGLASVIQNFINGMSPTDEQGSGFLQASDIINLCYESNVDFVDLQSFSVKISIDMPTSSRSWTEVDRVEYELYGEDIRHNIIFKYFAAAGDINAEKIP